MQESRLQVKNYFGALQTWNTKLFSRQFVEFLSLEDTYE